MGRVRNGTNIAGPLIESSRPSLSSRYRTAFSFLALVFLGAAAGMAHATSATLQIAPVGQAAGEELGVSVAGAGDVNGDGFPDLIAGAFCANSFTGRAYLYYGGVDADSIPDLMFVGEEVGDRFGVSVAGAGDVNGDGYSDVIIGGVFNGAGGELAGRAYVFFGGPSPDNIPDLTLTGLAPGDRFGAPVAGAGDVNGDGFSDILVGAPRNDVAGTDAGRAYVFFGGVTPDNTADLVFTGEAAFDRFGSAAAGAGDVNADGYDDIIIGAYFNDTAADDAGRAYVFYCGPTVDAIPDLVFTGTDENDNLGNSVSGAGDVDGDGASDVIVGAPRDNFVATDAGRAFVYFGGLGADNVADLVFSGEAASDFFGYSVAGAGDVNGDEFDDLIVGANFNDAAGVEAGRAYVFFGGPTADSTADYVLDGEADNDRFGRSVAGAGDVNADGFDDLWVGAYLNDHAGDDAGRAYLYTAPAVSSLPRVTVESPNAPGLIWPVGFNHEITWSTIAKTPIESVSIHVSRDSGSTYEAIVSGHPNTGSFLWLVTGPPNNVDAFPVFSSMIKVVASDSAGVTGEDTSDRLFAIYDLGLTATSEQPRMAFDLEAISPNPSSRRARIVFTVARRARISLAVLDVHGRELEVLVNDVRQAGRYSAEWNGRTGPQMAIVPPGIYFVRYRVPGADHVKRLAITR